MIALTHSVTGHRISTDDASVEFWKAAGYRESESKKSTAKRSSSRKSSK